MCRLQWFRCSDQDTEIFDSSFARLEPFPFASLQSIAAFRNLAFAMSLSGCCDLRSRLYPFGLVAFPNLVVKAVAFPMLYFYYYDQHSIVFRKDRIAFPTLEAKAHLAKQHLELVLDWWWSWMKKLLMPVAEAPGAS